ncbi:MAG: septum formation initiator family protein [Bacteroidales bacterium]|jgi:cell division protein FtsB|nr:septum formation initiator family protein [Bacteroidales bacterium]MDD2264751.1 septum formation initiator family protein [Bacteroidales bacterium]MDD2831849.1 septum formation initiator family protein [Bacteroidales bacterium]MDD3209152.1 septum formation initiator family protein [Bacteroidales bacterium]MDD3697972.1 septum formation initiator family protein [Bacteroidales bacterium]
MHARFKFDRLLALIRNRYFIVTLVFIVWILFFDDNSFTGWVRALGEYSENKSQQRYYKEKIHQTESNLRELQSNKDSLEKFAREKYYFHKENEDVFIISPAPSDPADRFPYR